MAASASSPSRTPAPSRATKTTSSGSSAPTPTVTVAVPGAGGPARARSNTMSPSHRAAGARSQPRTADSVPDTRQEEDAGMVPAARQVLALLDALARQPGPVPAGVLVRELGLPRSTVYHLLGELTAAGLAVH